MKGSEKMNENKKILIIIGVISAIIALIVFGMIQTNAERNKVINEFNQAYESKTEKLVYLGRPGCSACVTFRPIFEKVINDHKLSFVDINTDTVTTAQLEEIVTKIGLELERFGTPTIAVVKDGKVVNSSVGVISEDALLEFLKNNNVIAK